MRRRPLGLLVTLAGAGLLVLGGWSAAQLRLATHGRPWFAAPTGLAVASDGTLFVGLAGGQVLAYDGDGRPLLGWVVAGGGGALRLRIEPAGDVAVATARDGRVRVYSPRGELVEEREEPDAFERIGAAGERRASTASGEVYELGPEGLVRVAPEPRRVLVAGPPWPLAWLGSHPLVPLIAALVSGSTALLAGVVLSSARV